MLSEARIFASILYIKVVYEEEMLDAAGVAVDPADNS